MKSLFTLFLFVSTFIQMYAQSPGGVSSGLVVWFNADQLLSTNNDGDFISLWPDLSNQANTASQTIVTQQPRLRKYGFNSHAAVEFNGNSFLQFDLTDISGSSFTIFAIVKQQPVTASGKFFLGIEQTSPSGLHIGYPTSETIRMGQNNVNTNSTAALFDVDEESPRLVTARLHPAAGRSISEIVDGVRRQGTQGSTASPSFTATARLGKGHSNSGFPGFVAELIVYNRALSDQEVEDVENYLSFKYATTLPDGVATFFNSAEFNHDVAAIGRFDNWGLNQTTTKSENPDEILRVTTLQDLEEENFVAVGNNNSLAAFDPLPSIQCGVSDWMQRHWLVEKTPSPEFVNLSFDLSNVPCSPERVALCIDSNGNGFDDDELISGIYDEPFIVFQNVPLGTGDRFTLAQTVTTLYAVASGNSTDAIWSSALDGEASFVGSWCDRTDVVIPAGRTVNATSNLLVKNFTISSGATFQANSTELIVSGNFINSGNFQAGMGRVQFAGNEEQTIQLNTPTTFYQIDINTADRVTIAGSMASLGHVLSFSQGVLITNGLLTVLSTATRQGAIGPLTNGDLQGNIVMQRRTHRTNVGWMSIGNCIQGKTLHDWNDDLLLTGFPGSDIPSQGFNNVQTYLESAPGNTNQGFFGVTSINQSISLKNGFFVYTSTGTLNIDVDGEIFKGDQSLPVSYTNTGNPTADGWSLVSNPYPCAINWESEHWQKTNVNNAVYVWNAPNAQHSSYVNGVGTNGGSPLIASSQAFFVVANSSAPSLIISEEAKTTQTVNFRSSDTTDPMLRMRVMANGKSDEAVVRFTNLATENFDGDFDAFKVNSFSEEGPSLQTFDASQIGYAIQSLPLQDEMIIPLSIQSPTKENVTFTCSGFESLCHFDIFLEKVADGHLTPLSDRPTVLLTPTRLDDPSPNYHIVLNRKKEKEHGQDGLRAYSLQGMLHIHQNFNDFEKGTLRVFNSMGQLLLEDRIAEPSWNSSFAHASGQYIIHFTTDSGQQHKMYILHAQP